MEKCKPCMQDLNGGCWLRQQVHRASFEIPTQPIGDLEEFEVAQDEIKHIVTEKIQHEVLPLAECMGCPILDPKPKEITVNVFTFSLNQE